MDTTALIRMRYNRVAKYYDLMDRMIKEEWRREAIGHVRGRILEVGVGTGKNLRFYTPGSDLTGIDFSPEMLKRARVKAEKLGLNAALMEMDAQNMSFPDHSFDTVLVTCVFCSVPDPVQGFREIKRVCKPDGQVILLEHMRSENPLAGRLMDFLNPFVVSLNGANINRETISNIKASGLKLVRVTNKKGTIVKLIQAAP